MNWEQVSGNWHQVKGKVREQWGELTDDDVDRAEGKYEMLVGRLQARYGLAKEDAERQVSDWLKTMH